MGITMFTLDRLLAPLHALFGSPQRSLHEFRRRVGNSLPSTSHARHHGGGQQSCPPYRPCRPAGAAARKPLRIVHSGAGRLVISGRMADVCAELDRLAALEAAAG